MVYIVSLVAWITYVEQALPDLVAATSRTLPVTIALAWLLLPGRHGLRVIGCCVDEPGALGPALAWVAGEPRSPGRPGL